MQNPSGSSTTRQAANEAIRVGDEKNLTSRKELHSILYRPLRESFYAKYTAGAITCAKSKLKLQDRKKDTTKCKAALCEK